MAPITNIYDLKALHKKRTPKMFYDYAESGSWSEQTFRDNSDASSQIRLRQRVAVDLSKRSIAGKMVGHDVTLPQIKRCPSCLVRFHFTFNRQNPISDRV